MFPTSPNTAISKPNLPHTQRAGFLCRTNWEILYPDSDPRTDQLLDEGKILVTASGSTLACDCGNDHPLELIQNWMIGMCSMQHLEYTDERRANMASNGKNQRGPVTVKGKLIASMNGLKHGAYSRKHLLPRAQHGELAACDTCPFFDRCGSEKWVICELQMPEVAGFINAHKGDGASAIASLVGDVQARHAFLLKHSLDRAIREGVTVKRRISKTYGRGENSTHEETEWEELSPVIVATGILTKNLGGIGINDWKLTPQSEKQAENQVQLQQLILQISEKYSPPTPAQ